MVWSIWAIINIQSTTENEQYLGSRKQERQQAVETLLRRILRSFSFRKKFLGVGSFYP